jgi:uncharacterized protein (TIGR02611 family)
VFVRVGARLRSWGAWLDAVLERERQRRGGRVLVRIVVTVAGAAVIGVGIILLPLPGPGWLIIFSGLAIWAIEYPWARRLLKFARTQVTRWTRWYTRQSGLVRAGVGVLTLAFLAGIVALGAWISLST